MPDNSHNQNNWEMYQPDLTTEHPRHQRMLEPLISLYQDGEADEVEKATVEQYLSACAECRAVNESFSQLSGNLRNYTENIPVPHFNRQAYPFLDEIRAVPPANRAIKSVKPTAPARLTDDRLGRIRPKRVGFAYSLAGGMAAVLLIGMVAAFLFLVMQQVNSPKGNNLAANQVAVASQTQAAIQNSLTAGSQTTTPATQSPAPTSPATQSPGATSNPGLAEPENTPPPDTRAAVSSPAVPVQGATQKSPAATSQKPAATATAIPVPTNTPGQSSRTTTTTAQATVQPTAEPTQAVATTTTAAPVETEAATTTPAITVDTAAVLATPAPSSPTAEQVTSTPVPAASPAIAPGWIAYVDQSDGQIHLVKADGRNDEVISDPTVSRNFVYEKLAWSNDGKLLAAVGLNTNNGMRNVYLLDIASPLRVEAVAEGFAPSWSPDNLSIAFLANPITIKDGIRYGRPAIFSLRKRTVSYISTSTDNLAPQWFEDGSRLLIGQDRVYNVESGLVSTFKLPFTNTCLAAALSASGDKLANLELQANGDYQTVIYDFSKGQVDPKKPLARATAPVQGKVGINCGSQRVHWTPDSRFVYYYVNNGTNPSTCLIAANGNSTRCLSNVYEPSFNSNSTALVDFSLSSSGDGQVYAAPSTITARPVKPRLIAESVIPPVWQPL
ncbi:MAG: hypothetical protein JWP00_2990 [Chloroflexi bacterium]|nr:hypothetical protein [Chloroflexota bacterium]